MRHSNLMATRAALLAAISISTVGCGTHRSSGAAVSVSTAAASSLDVNATCALEATFEAGVLSTGNVGTQSLITAIGLQSAQFHLALGLVGPLNQLIQQEGVSAAIPGITAQARSNCQQANNPILTVGQADSLKLIVPADNAVALGAVVNFASSPMPAAAQPQLPAAAPPQLPTAAPSQLPVPTPSQPAGDAPRNSIDVGALDTSVGVLFAARFNEPVIDGLDVCTGAALGTTVGDVPVGGELTCVNQGKDLTATATLTVTATPPYWRLDTWSQAESASPPPGD